MVGFFGAGMVYWATWLGMLLWWGSLMPAWCIGIGIGPLGMVCWCVYIVYGEPICMVGFFGAGMVYWAAWHGMLVWC